MVSPSRWAARPVGEQRANFKNCVCRIVTKERIKVVFPVPGPPVITVNDEFKAVSIASFCRGAKSIDKILWAQFKISESDFYN